MKKLIVANWKMYPPTQKEAEELFSNLKEAGRRFSKTFAKIKVVICPPFVWLAVLAPLSRKSKIALASQDVFWKNKGSYTGAISPLMLRNLGVKYVVVGHSERRRFFGETDEMINKKIKAALKANLKVIFCLGESRRDEEGEYLRFLKKEIFEGLNKVSRKEARNLIIAYEPIWAISSSKNARPDKPEELFKMTIYLRRLLFSKFGKKVAYQTPILYGGSVDFRNGRDFLEKGNVQGLLVGRTSWKSSTFLKLLQSF